MKKSYIYILIFIFGLFSFSSDVWSETKVGSITYDEVTKLADKGCDSLVADKWMHKLTNSKYTGSCMYVRSVENADKTGNACHIIEVDFGKNDVLVTEYDPVKGKEYSNKYVNNEWIKDLKSNVIFKFTTDIDKNDGTPLTGSYILEYTDNVGTCLPFIRVVRKDEMQRGTRVVSSSVYAASGSGESYSLKYVRGKTSGTGEDLTMSTNLDIQFAKNKNIENCEDLFGKDIVRMFKNCWNILKIVVPIILLGLGTLDFAKAVFASEDNMKKAQSKFIKRIIIAVAIFVIPSVLSLLLNVGNEIFGIFGKNGTDICGLFG